MTSETTYSAEEIEARIETVKRVRESWKGQPGYLRTIDMEIWAFTVAAKLVRTCAQVVDFQAKRMTIELSPADRAHIVQSMCEKIDGSESLLAIFGPNYEPPAGGESIDLLQPRQEWKR